MNIKIHNTIKIIAFLQMLLIPGFILAQKPSAGEILEAVKDKMSAVKSYEAHITINVDVDFINMKERKGTVTFRHPNVLEFDTQGFALLPKRGMEMEYMQLLNTEYTAIDVGEVTIQGIPTQKIKVIPSSDSLKIILAEIFIDTLKNRIYRMHTFTREAGSYVVNFSYADHPYDLPDLMVVEFNIENQNLPGSFMGDFESFGKQHTGEKTKGQIIIDYQDYKVNIR